MRRRLRRGRRLFQERSVASAPEGAAVLPHWGSSLTSASCLSSRARHIHVPLDPQCGRTASFGAFGAALRSSGCLAWQSADRSDAASTEYGRPRAAQRGRGGGKASRLPGFYKRSHDLHVREGRRALGICPKWHMDVPRPFVKTGCRPEGWDISPGYGGPSRCQRFNRTWRPLKVPALQQDMAAPQGASAWTGHGGPSRCQRLDRAWRPRP